VDGPEFDGHEVDFQELGRRLKAYSEEEAAAINQLAPGAAPQDHDCKLEKSEA
jgi:hypothetical protein